MQVLSVSPLWSAGILPAHPIPVSWQLRQYWYSSVILCGVTSPNPVNVGGVVVVGVVVVSGDVVVVVGGVVVGVVVGGVVVVSGGLPQAASNGSKTSITISRTHLFTTYLTSAW